MPTSTDPPPTQSSVHQARRDALANIEDIIQRMDVTELGPKEIEAANIHPDRLTYDADGKPSFEPCFFDPYPVALLPEPSEEFVTCEYPDYDGYPNGPSKADSPLSRGDCVLRYIDTYALQFHAVSKLVGKDMPARALYG